MTRWYQSEAVSVVLATAYFAAFLAVLMAASGCTAEGLTMTVTPEDADAHPELVETISEAIADMPDLKLVVTPETYGPRWRVVGEVPCVYKSEACTKLPWDLDPQLARVYITRGATGRLDVVSHEIGHLLDPGYTHPVPAQ